MAALEIFRGASYLLLLSLATLTHASIRTTEQSREHAATTPVIEPNVAVVPGQGHADGTCRCSVNLPAVVLCTDYQTRDNDKKLQEVQSQIAKLTAEVKDLHAVSNRHSQLIDVYENNLLEITSAFELIEAGQLLVTRAVIEDIQRRIQSMESALYSLKEWHGLESDTVRNGKIQIVMHEMLNISGMVDAMVAQGASEDVASMRREIADLDQQLRICNSTQAQRAAAHGRDVEEAPATTAGHTKRPLPTTRAPTAAPTEGSGGASEEGSFPERWPAREKQNSCSRLVRVGEPYTLRAGLNDGTWTRDPLVNPDFIYYQRFSTSSRYSNDRDNRLNGSLSLKAFQSRETSQMTGLSDISIDESIVYNGSIFAYSSRTFSEYHYNSQSEKKLSKIQLSKTQPFTFASQDLITKRRLTSSDDTMDRTGYSAATVVPKMDLTVDESGLWVLYGDANGMLTASRVDQDTLELGQTWQGSFPKNQLANCFVVCGKVYCINNYSSFNSRISYYMDTASGIEGFANIPFMVKYGSLSSIEYNPRDQLLYGVDSGLAVVYPLIFEE